MAAPGELLPRLQQLQVGPAPADVDGVLGRLLAVQGGVHLQPVIGLPGEVLRLLRGEDQGVELPVRLEHTAPVDGDDLPVIVKQRGGGGDLGVIEGHRPVSHDDVFGEGVSLPPEVVVFHALPPVQGLHMLQGGDAPVDEHQVLRLQDSGQSGQPGMDLRIALPQGGAQAGEVHPVLEAHLIGQLADGALRVLGEIAGVKPAVQLVRLKEAEHQPVAVAADGVHRVGAGELHHIPEQGQAVPPLLQHVPVQHQDVLRREPDFLEQSPEEGQISMDVAHRQDAAAGGKFRVDHTGGILQANSLPSSKHRPPRSGGAGGGAPFSMEIISQTCGSRKG